MNAGLIAIDGGTPAKKTPMLYWYPGARRYGDEEINEVLDVLRSKSTFRYYGINPPGKTKLFEDEFAEKMGARYALGVNSGTAALFVALQAAGVGYGDEVIVPPCTHISTAGTVVMLGAIPVFAEIDKSLSINPADIEKKITDKTKAVIPVHWNGGVCDMDAIMDVAGSHGLTVIEDCAQSCGASYHGKRIGSIGDINCFSLQYNKIMTTGEGGVVTTSDPLLFEKAVRAHDQGQLRSQHEIEPQLRDCFGMGARMSELTAAVALAQLRKLDDQIVAALRTASRIILDGLKDMDALELRHTNDAKGDIGATVSFFLKKKEDVPRWIAALTAENVDTATSDPYHGGIHRNVRFLEKRVYHPSSFPFLLSDRSYKENVCPHTTELLERLVFIKLPSDIVEEEAHEIAAGVRKVAAAYGV